MKRPSIYAALYFILGIIISHNIDLLHNYVILILGIILSSLSLMLYTMVRKAVFVTLLLFLGIFIGFKSIPPSDENLYNITSNEGEGTIKCEILDLYKVYEDRYAYIAKCQYFENSSNKIDINSKAIMYSDVYYNVGDYIKSQGELTPIKKENNTSLFDNYGYMRSIGIEYTLSDSESSIIESRKNLNYYIISFRNRLSENFDKIMLNKEASFMKATLLGDRADMDSDLYDILKEGGVAHIISISGLHISIIAGAIIYIFSKINRWLSYVITTLFLILYGIMTGMSPPVIRSILMTEIFILSYVLGRKYDTLSSVSFSLMIMLFINPFYLYNIGFCYSFAAVYGIGISVEIIKNFDIKNKTLISILNLAAVSFAANLFTKPITAYNFYNLYSWDLVSNIIIVPFVSIVMGLGILANMLTFISVELGELFASIPVMLINFYEFVCTMVINLPYYKIATGGISLYTVVAIYLLFVVIYNIFFNIKNIIHLYIPISVLFVSSMLPKERIHYIDTGSIYSVAIYEGKNAIMYNCGSHPGSQFAKDRILDFLDKNNIENISCIYVSNTKYQNVGGILEIYDDVNIDKIVILGEAEGNMYDRLVSVAESKDIEIEYGLNRDF